MLVLDHSCTWCSSHDNFFSLCFLFRSSSSLFQWKASLWIWNAW
jgi:hypothetical protein